MICCGDLKTCNSLLLLLLAFSALLPRAWADEWISEEYRCAMTIPTQESWTAAIRQPLPVGEVILHAISMTTSQGIMVTFVPEMPSGDLGNPALAKRILELIESQGWQTERVSPIDWMGRPALQLITQRRDVVAGKLSGIARATMRGRSLYVVTAYGKGETTRAEDPDFTRVMDTFRFVEQAAVVVDHPPGHRPFCTATPCTLLQQSPRSSLSRSRSSS